MNVYVPRPRLHDVESQLTNRKVAVIGAGVVGACTALMLQHKGHETTIIDPRPPGEGASFGNAGCFNASSVVPMSMPGMLKDVPGWLLDPMGPLSVRWSYLPQIAPWLIRFILSGTREKVAQQARALRSLLAPAMAEMTALARAAGADDLIRHQGHLYVYRSEKGFQKDQGGWALRRDNGVDIEILDQLALRAFDPALSTDFVRGVRIPENGHTINPGLLVKRLMRQALRQGASLKAASATGISLDGVKVRAVHTEDGDVIADVVVVAAGAHSKVFTDRLGDRVPLDTERGYHLMISDPEVQPRQPTTDAEGKFVVTMMQEGLRLAGTVEFGGLELPPDWRRSRVLLDHVKQMLPGLSRSYEDTRLTQWMGFRPSLPDSLPVIGRSSRSPNIFYGFGHGHVGMTGGPMTGKILAQIISEEPPAIDIAPFSPKRFG